MDDARKPAETSTSPEVPHECNPKTDTFGQVAFDQSFHFLGKGTRITQRRTFLNARSENDRVGASPDKLPCP